MNQSDFSSIADLNLPEGAPVFGYKLVYHATDGNYYPYMNRNPFNLEYGIAHPDEEVIEGLPIVHGQINSKEQYKKDEPNVYVPSRRFLHMPHGYYYWQDRGVAEEYARWASPQPSEYMKGGNEFLQSGRFELLRVEGTHVIKTENEKDVYNEGHVMDNMMFVDKTPLLAFDINGNEVDASTPFEEYIKTSPPAYKRQ